MSYYEQTVVAQKPAAHLLLKGHIYWSLGVASAKFQVINAILTESK